MESPDNNLKITGKKDQKEISRNKKLSLQNLPNDRFTKKSDKISK